VLVLVVVVVVERG